MFRAMIMVMAAAALISTSAIHVSADMGTGSSDNSSYQNGMGQDGMEGAGMDNPQDNPMDGGSHMGMTGMHSYESFDVDMNMDIFTNPEVFTSITGYEFMDENGDGICDAFQETELFYSMGWGEWMDTNGDSIGDMFQTMAFYEYMGMTNFVDVDGDGVCDNYEENPWYTGGDDSDTGMPMNMGSVSMHHYEGFEVDTSKDIFSDSEMFMSFTGFAFVDENNDGIADMFQNSGTYYAMGFGEWIDENNDGIADMFQTRGMYNFMHMTNFVDVDGDGLCDNYVQVSNETSASN